MPAKPGTSASKTQAITLGVLMILRAFIDQHRCAAEVFAGVRSCAVGAVG